MVPVDRRTFLAGGAAGATTALAGCLGDSSTDIAMWTPAEETWPLARYGPANTGHNPNATPPRDGVDSAWQVDTAVRFPRLVVARDLVVVYGRNAMVVLSATNPEADVYRTSLPTPAAGFAPGADQEPLELYAASTIGHDNDVMIGLLRGWEFRPEADSIRQSLRQRYEFGDNGGRPTGLITTGDTLYVGDDGAESIVAMDPTDGSIRWRVSGAYPALASDRLLASGYTVLAGYRPRDGLDARLNAGPTEAWTAAGDQMAPAVRDGQVFIGQEHSPVELSLCGYEAATGDALWDPVPLDGRPHAPAIVSETGYVGVTQYEDPGPNSASRPDSGALVAVDLREGSVIWRREADWWHLAPVAGGNDVVLAYGADPEDEADPFGGTGYVRAYDADSGESLWTFTAPAPIDALAPVGATVYAGSRDGTVYALA